MEQQLCMWIASHSALLFAVYLVFNLAVQALPKPTDKSGMFYVWLYGFSHALAMNAKVVFKLIKGNDEK